MTNKVKLEIGQEWYVKLPFIVTLSKRKIKELTSETVLVYEPEDETKYTSFYQKDFRYKISDLDFVELIPNKEDKYKQYLGKKLNGRIKLGTSVGVDHRFLIWADVNNPGIFEGELLETRFPYIIFDVELFTKSNDPATYMWRCTADGYGRLKDYGSGALYVNSLENVELLNP